jgi:hypothetical protein
MELGCVFYITSSCENIGKTKIVDNNKNKITIGNRTFQRRLA